MIKPLMVGLVNILHWSTMATLLSIIVVSEVLIEHVLHDHIPHLSDHAKLSVKLSASFLESNKLFENNTCQHMPNSYKW